VQREKPPKSYSIAKNREEQEINLQPRVRGKNDPIVTPEPMKTQKKI
jgi:hypothetical protein